MISCGVALHHAQVAADALGWSATVTRLPEPDQPDLLARLVLAPTTSSRHAPETARRHRQAVHRPPPVHLVAGPRRAAHPPRRPGVVPRCPRSPPDRCLRAGPRRAARHPRHRRPARRPAGDAGAAGMDRPWRRRRRPVRGAPPPRPTSGPAITAGSRPAWSTTWAAASRGVRRAARPLRADRRPSGLAHRRRGAERHVARSHGGRAVRPHQPGDRGRRDRAASSSRCSVAWHDRSP